MRRKRASIDVLTATEASTLGLKDPPLLVWAADRNRILLSHDKRTMPDHLDQFLAGGRHSPGIILILRRLPIGRIIDDLLLIWEASTAEEYRDLITRLPL